MNLFSKLFPLLISKLLFVWSVDSSVLPNKLSVDCFTQNSNEFLTKLETYKHIESLVLKGFSFDEANVIKFSDIVCKLQLKELSLIQCNINDELASLLMIPSCLKLIHIERLNLSSEGIRCIIKKLPSALESLEILDDFENELGNEKVLLNLSRFSSLRRVCLENLSGNFDIIQLMVSLAKFPLESIRLCRPRMNSKDWHYVFDKWTDILFSKTLQVFDVEMGRADKNAVTRLIGILFSFPSLRVITLDTFFKFAGICLPPLPPTIKQLNLKCIDEVKMETNVKSSIYNFNYLSQFQLTHLTAYGSFQSFPYDLFLLKQLEYLEIYSYKLENYSSQIVEPPLSNLKQLSIQYKYLIPLLPTFTNNFPMIETVEIIFINFSNFTFSHLDTILSCKLLKCLHLNYLFNPLNLNKQSGNVKVSFIEELRIFDVSWEFVSLLLENIHFPHLKKINFLLTDSELSLENVFEKLQSLPLLSSLTLSGEFRQAFTKEKFPFKFENLSYFYFESYNATLDLDKLLCCMPNLIELQLDGPMLMNVRSQSLSNIRYLSLPFYFKKLDEIVINLIKNIPNLIQLRRKWKWYASFENSFLVSELAYYLTMLKSHFNDKLAFDINSNCLPILLLEKDVYLLQLVRLKSFKLPSYLNQKLPSTKCKSIIKQLFTIEIEKNFSLQLVDSSLFTIYQFTIELGIKKLGLSDISFLKQILEEGKNRKYFKSNDFSLGYFFILFEEYLERKTKTKLTDYHLIFIEQFFQMNKQFNILKRALFLESFFITLSVNNNNNDSAIGSEREINFGNFNLFSKNILSNSFFMLIDKIKNKQLDENEVSSLRLIFPLNFDLLAIQLRFLTPDSYKQFIVHFNRSFFKFDIFFISIKNSLSNFKIFSASHETCSICLLEFNENQCKFYQSKSDNKPCHLFHEYCLDEWLKVNNSCPICRTL